MGLKRWLFLKGRIQCQEENLTIISIMRSPLTKNFITIVFPIIISIQIKASSFLLYNWWEKDFYLKSVHILITISIYIALVIKLNALDNNFETTKKKAELYNEVSYNLAWVIMKFVEKQKTLNTMIADNKQHEYLNYIGGIQIFQDTCIYVCDAIYRILKICTKKEEHQVSVLYNFPSDKAGDKSIKMIAYSNNGYSYPDWNDVNYNSGTRSNEKGKENFYRKIFENKNPRPYALSNRKEIDSEIGSDNTTIERINKIQQYVGLPITFEKEVVGLLQIDTVCEGLMGKTEKEIMDFISPLQVLLHILIVIYTNNKVVNTFCKKLEKICKNKS